MCLMKIHLIYHWTNRQIVHGFLGLACHLSTNDLLVISRRMLGDDRNGQKGLVEILPSTDISLQRHVTPQYGCRGLLLNVPARTQC